ncbi:MAG: 3-phosphoglycerate dehydrogenase family protein, partial [Rhodocyclaceae bacterium]|nr:3-phosphoglycerate dehydrogenase family protein [Rhodocyclaceae bacterium]
MFNLQILNNVSQNGLKRFPPEGFTCAKEVANPDAILLRSADLHSVEIPTSVLAIGRAGSGTNNIPVKAMSARGIPVFNAPGANANAVKELVLAGMLMAARNIGGAMKFVSGLDPSDAEMEKKVEGGKKTYAGYEITGHTLGVVGLGKIGCLIADAAIKLGMNVVGYDPEITVEAAWSLPSQVKKANSLNEVLKSCHFVTLHVPLVDATRKMINADSIGQMKPSAVLLNFARNGVVDESAVLAALDAKKLAAYVCDFPSALVNHHPQVIALPHLGASTREAEENCAMMVVDQVRDYLLDGNIVNSVNFPSVLMPRESGFRLAISNANVPNMVGQISTAMADAKLNIHNMMNKSRGDVAYTLVDVDS